MGGRDMNQKGITLLEVIISAVLIMIAGAALLTLVYFAHMHTQIQPATASYLMMNKVDEMAGVVRASQWSTVTDPMYPTTGAVPEPTKTLEGRNYNISYTVAGVPGREAEMRRVHVKVAWETPA